MIEMDRTTRTPATQPRRLDLGRDLRRRLREQSLDGAAARNAVRASGYPTGAEVRAMREVAS